MNSFYVFSGKKIKRFLYIFAAALLTAGVVYVERAISPYSLKLPLLPFTVCRRKRS